MKRLRWLSFLCAAVLCLSVLASCGKTETDAPEADPADTTAAAEHPAGSFAGLYTESKTGVGSLEVIMDQADSVLVTIRWINSSNETLIWNMSGTFQKRTNTIRYENCLKTQLVSLPDGGSDLIVGYRDGKGTIRFSEEGITWTDEEEHFADDALFIRS